MDNQLILVAAIIIFSAAVVLFLRKPKKLVALQSGVTHKFKLIEREEISHDTRRFRFELPSEKHALGLPIGQHIYLKIELDGKKVSRAYTPISSDDDLGYFDLIVKVYFKNVHPKFPDGGKLTQYLESMKIGDTIDCSGPSGKITYPAAHTFNAAKGVYAIEHKRPGPEIIKTKRVGMIAGGSGITPMLQVATQMLKDENDKTEIWLLFANQTEKDILCREQLEALEKKHSRFHVWYTIDKAEDGWEYSTGFINVDMVRDHLPSPADDSVILICGPPPMIKFACVPVLTELGFNLAKVLTF